MKAIKAGGVVLATLLALSALTGGGGCGDNHGTRAQATEAYCEYLLCSSNNLTAERACLRLFEANSAPSGECLDDLWRLYDECPQDRSTMPESCAGVWE